MDSWTGFHDTDNHNERTISSLEALASYRARADVVAAIEADTFNYATMTETRPYTNVRAFFTAANSARSYPVPYFVR